ncbi:hypothetical protein QGM71_08325 [Virgibacillus sp. C22-A2]|uniref:Uncharacterized protein n=1 Tax=Virgibacillus tibetensis TaxID=3042313 RepID=A0ABU6KDU0_9BACI|nr:hypothetical protein [Virgibacillus sp. C22-A2]
MKKYLNLNTVYIAAAIIAFSFLLIPRLIETVNLRVEGISYVANDIENYLSNAHPIEGEFTVQIDLRELENNEGKVLFDDGENKIYVSKVNVHDEAGYEVFFRSSGDYNLGGATLVSGVKHAGNNGFTNRLQAEAKATYKEVTYNLSPSASSGLNHRDGDEFGFYMDVPDKIDLEEPSVVDVIVSKLYVNIWAKKP